jgi:hypothetical protein
MCLGQGAKWWTVVVVVMVVVVEVGDRRQACYQIQAGDG